MTFLSCREQEPHEPGQSRAGTLHTGACWGSRWDHASAREHPQDRSWHPHAVPARGGGARRQRAFVPRLYLDRPRSETSARPARPSATLVTPAVLSGCRKEGRPGVGGCLLSWGLQATWRGPTPSSVVGAGAWGLERLELALHPAVTGRGFSADPQVCVPTGTGGQFYGAVLGTVHKQRTEWVPGLSTPGAGINKSTRFFFLGRVSRL